MYLIGRWEEPSDLARNLGHLISHIYCLRWMHESPKKQVLWTDLDAAVYSHVSPCTQRRGFKASVPSISGKGKGNACCKRDFHIPLLHNNADFHSSNNVGVVDTAAVSGTAFNSVKVLRQVDAVLIGDWEDLVRWFFDITIACQRWRIARILLFYKVSVQICGHRGSYDNR